MLSFLFSYTSSHDKRVPADKIVSPMLNTSARDGLTPAGYLAFCTESFANYYGAM